MTRNKFDLPERYVAQDFTIWIVEEALEDMKTGKAAGLDRIYGGFLKQLSPQGAFGTQKSTTNLQISISLI